MIVTKTFYKLSFYVFVHSACGFAIWTWAVFLKVFYQNPDPVSLRVELEVSICVWHFVIISPESQHCSTPHFRVAGGKVCEVICSLLH